MGSGDTLITGGEATDSPEFSAVGELGLKLTSEYIKLVNGPLKQHNWSTDKAKDILTHFQSQQALS